MTSNDIQRLDSFVNALTGMGDAAVDKGAAWSVADNTLRLSIGSCRNIYRKSYYARRVVNLTTSDALVRGWSVKDPADRFVPEDSRWKTEAERLRLHEKLAQADVYASIYGTGYLIPITYDGLASSADLSSPLDLSKLHTISQILVLTPEQCLVERRWVADSATADILQPSAYRLQISTMKQFKGRWGKALAGQQLLHPSRVIKIVGDPMDPDELSNATFGEGWSVFEALFYALARAEGIDNAAAILAQEFKQDVIKIGDLKAIGTGDGQSLFKTRMRLLKAGLSLTRMVVLGQGEDFESRATGVSGFKDLSDNARNALVAATGIPEPILFGKATSGLATAPGTEQEAYIRLIEDRQRTRIEPALRQLLRLVAANRSGSFGGKRKYSRFTIEFNPLTIESKKDKAARKLILGQLDSVHVGMLKNAGDLEGAKHLARHIIESRYGPHGWMDELPPVHLPAPGNALPPDGASPPPSTGTKQAPPGQLPNTSSAPDQGGNAPGVDVQVNNTGKGQFDAYEFLEQLDRRTDG